MSSPSQAQRRLHRLAAHVTASAAPRALPAWSEPTGPSAPYKHLHVGRAGRVAVLTLYRPRQLNALNDALMDEVGRAMHDLDLDEGVGCVVLTGAGRAFAAGADIKEMAGKGFYEMMTVDKIKPWERICALRVPLIAAVNGFALGGGCEISMMCDIVLCSDRAKFGQPEINIGTIPGAGGTQRLPRAVGKSLAMELALGGGMIGAERAVAAGLASRVVPHHTLMGEALSLAARIASKSRPMLMLAKEAVNAAYNTTLDQGMRVERRIFHSTFALDDQTEGMNAFAEKRKPDLRHR